ncbi:MAG TPA: FecR family protein [Candidatus Lachnoclostridium stercoravium]|uniref:FecR family protein n=1 Tax=Candidatus Lachnoclostridium stercoravium TaxID=2838633 RepID=A0A9D2HG05_9FIRM|nr:FecR family protein [Candidatus Lachnoclostridium stercoravium]
MRRKQIGAAVVFLIALVFLGVNIAAVADDLVGEARSLSVLSVSGDEAVVMRGANREIKAAAGMPLGQGTKAKTGAGTNMYLQADEDKTIKMGSSTLVEITKASAKKLGITLKSGEIFFNVEQKLADDEEMIFHAAQTSLSIRGTSGFLIQEPGGETTLFLLEGMVEWSAGEETITLEAGQTGTYVPARDMRGDSLKNEGDFQWEDLDAFCLETLLNDISGIELEDFGLTSDQIPEALKRVQELEQEAREQEAILQSQAESFAQENSPGPDRDGLIVGGREPAEEDGGDNDKEIPIEDDRTEAETTEEETTEETTEEETTEEELTEETTEEETTEETTEEETSEEETTEEETTEEETTEEETTEEETEPVPAPEIIGNAYGYVVDKSYVGELQEDGSEVSSSIQWDYWVILTGRGNGTYWLVEHTGNIYAWTESECNSYGLYPTP